MVTLQGFFATPGALLDGFVQCQGKTVAEVNNVGFTVVNKDQRALCAALTEDAASLAELGIQSYTWK